MDIFYYAVSIEFCLVILMLYGNLNIGMLTTLACRPNRYIGDNEEVNSEGKIALCESVCSSVSPSVTKRSSGL